MSWQIDPSTGDYLMVNGAPVDDDSLIYPAYYRTRIGRGQWLHAPDSNFGSDFPNLDGKFSNVNSLQAIQQQALQPMIDDGRALAVDVTVDTTAQTLRSNAAMSAVITSAEGLTDTLPLQPVGD